MPLYEPAGFFLLRAPVLPVRTYLDVTKDPARTPQDLLDLAHRPEVERALLIASEGLADSLNRLGELSQKRVGKVHSRLLRYLTRMATRPTPFGAFSGVAMGEFGSETSARLGLPQNLRVRVRADMGWTLALIEQLEGDPELFRQLHLVLNPMAHLAGDRIVLPQADKYGRSDARSVRVRHTPAVDLVMQEAVAPVPYERLTETLAGAFTEASSEDVAGLIRQMWELGFLTGDLRPPQTADRPERHVLTKLSGLPAATPIEDRLRMVGDLAERAHDSDSLRRLAAAQRDLVPGHPDQTYQADSALNLHAPVLGEPIAQAAAEAVSVLMRISAARDMRNHLTRYREEFTERYGAGTRISILSLLSPDTGLDAPPTYTKPPRSIELPPLSAGDTTRLDGVLMEFAQQAWWDRAREVELTDSWLDRLAPTRLVQDPPPAMEAYLQIHAADRQAIDRSQWRAVMRFDSLSYGGRTFGRFSDLLGEEAVGRLRDYARREEDLLPDVVYAELAFVPPYGRAANVTLRPSIRPYEIPVNTTPSVPAEQVIPLDDILVGVTDDRFYLWSQRLDKEIVVAQHHMLSPELAPNVARFLIEASLDGYVQPAGFHWGPAESAPFLPRVTRGKVVLRPAQWRLERGAVDDLAGWRERWQVPRHVYLVEGDQRLLLDLDHPACRAELREELTKWHTLVFHEMLPSFEGMWLQDSVGDHYVSEVVVPLLATDAVRTIRRQVPRRDRNVPVQRHQPGSEWTFLKVYAAPERQDDIIAGPLLDLLSTLRQHDLLDRWFYIRYADPFPHLRLRVRGTHAARVLAEVTLWGRDLVERGTARDIGLDAYAPEIARYGGPEAFDVVEQLFQASSEAVALLLSRRLDIKPEFLAVAAVNSLYEQWGARPAQRRADSGGPDDTQMRETRELFRRHRDYLCELLSPWDRAPDEHGRAHRLQLAEAFATQAPAVARAAETVRKAQQNGSLVGSEDQVLASLAHMQINRLLPIDLDREARSHALWAHAARAIRGRMAAAAKEER